MIILLGVWGFCLVLLSYLRLKFFKFMVGSVGVFVMLLLNLNQMIEQYLLDALGAILEFLSRYVGYLDVYAQYGMLTITRATGVITFFLDYECTGILEILVYTSLVLFYPIHHFAGKVYHIVTGIVFIIGVNVLRVMVIVVIVHGMGMDYFFIAHTVIARLIFFVCMVTLYFRTFTLQHISAQKVG